MANLVIFLHAFRKKVTPKKHIEALNINSVIKDGF